MATTRNADPKRVGNAYHSFVVSALSPILFESTLLMIHVAKKIAK